MDFLKAVSKGDIPFIKAYINDRGDATVTDVYGNSALHLSKDAIISELLIEAGVNPKLQNHQSETPLHTWTIATNDYFMPSHNEYVKIIKMLLESGVSPNVQDVRGYTPVHILFIYGTELNIPDEILTEILELLLAYGVDTNLKDYEGRTSLHHAVAGDNITHVKLLLDSGATCNSQDKIGMTPCSHLYNSVHTEFMSLLLEYGADTCIPDIDGRTVLYYAASVGNYEMISTIVNYTSDSIKISDKNFVTALHTASAYKRTDVVELLLLYGADPNLKDRFNATSLHYGAYGGTLEIVTLLLEHGADPYIKDDRGDIPEECAVYRYFFNTAKKLQTGVVEATLQIPRKAKADVIDEIFLRNLPADDVFDMILPQSRVTTNALDTNVFPDGLLPYVNIKAKGNLASYISDMHNVPGIGLMPEIEEVKNIQYAIEAFAQRWVTTISSIDQRFQSTLVPSGSVYEGTKVGDPNEYDFLLSLDKFKHRFMPVITESSQYDDITVVRNSTVDAVADEFRKFCVGDELQSTKVISTFITVARRALYAMNYESGSNQLYIESLTEDTYINDTWIDTTTVTCNLKFLWTGSCYKQLTLNVDLVPAIAIQRWPVCALSKSCLITDDIKSLGCHIVCKKSKWRLSFSIAEKIILQRLSKQTRKAYTGAKLLLNGAVSARITLYDDSDYGSQLPGISGNPDNNKTDDDSNEEPWTLDERENTTFEEEERILEDNIIKENEELEEKVTAVVQDYKNSCKKDISDGLREDLGDLTANSGDILWLPATMVSKVKTVDESFLSILQPRGNTSVTEIIEGLGKNINLYVAEEDDHESRTSSSDIQTYTFEPRQIISSYLLKMTFFHVLEEHLSSTNTTCHVTTEHIFSKLWKYLKEDKPLQYYFVPKHDMLSQLKHTIDGKGIELTISLINYLFENVK